MLSRASLGWMKGRTARMRLIATVAGLIVAATAVGLLSQRATAARPEPWPSFTMVYEDMSDGGALIQRFRLVYLDSHHFTTTLLAHSTVPEAVGWTHTVGGINSSTTDPRLGTVSTATWKPEDQVLPSDWLRPGPKPWLAYRPTATTVALPGGLAQITLVSLIDGRQDVEEITYRVSDGIPTRFVETRGGRVARRVEVLELTLTK